MVTYETVTDAVAYAEGDAVPTGGCTSIDIACTSASDIEVTECETEAGTYTTVAETALIRNMDSSGNGLIAYRGYAAFIKASSSTGDVIVIKRGILHAPSTANTE